MTEQSKIADEIEAFVADDESYLVTLALARFIKAHLPALLTALRADSDAAVERAAKALYESMRASHEIEWETEEEWMRDNHRSSARAAIRAAVEP